MKNIKRNEILLYAAMWALIFAAPVLNALVRIMTDNSTEAFSWGEVVHGWKIAAPFFVVFLIHNFFIAPQLVYHKRRALYAVLLALMISAFAVYWYVDAKDNHGPKEEMGDMRKNGPPDMGDHDTPPMDEGAPMGDWMPMEESRSMDGERPSDSIATNDPANRPGPPPRPDGDHSHPGGKKKDEPPVMLGERSLMAFLMLLLTVGVNVYMKYYFRFSSERKRLKEIEKQNLEHQLEYLKYQINPHFFMNTLNNIHALVDIDPEMAKGTIVELSKMMRFVLYEAEKPVVRVQREVDFIRNYIKLMRLRYADSVKITLEVNEPIPDRGITPLVAIAFVENAFKHGVSYEHHSFINISYAFTDSTMIFRCTNSRNVKQDKDHGGVGLENVRRRLNLIYGDGYSLKITENQDTYNVELKMPFT